MVAVLAIMRVRSDMPKLSSCSECKWKYPDNLLNSMFLNGGHTPPMCGQCALEVSNKVHGVARRKFTAPIAEHMRLLALRWRLRNPKNKPD